MGFITAGHTSELRLAAAIPLRDMAAARTRPAGIRRRNLHQSAASPRQLVVQLPLKFMPALIQDRLVQSRFGPDPSPGMADRPLRRPGHVGHLQLLDVDDRVVLADLGRAFMKMVATAVGGLGMDLLDPQFLPRPVVAEFHFSTQGLLSLTEALLLPAKTVDRFVDGTVRQGGEPHDSCIRSHSFAFRRGRFALGFHLNRHVPPPAFAAHREVSQRPVHDPAVAVAHPSGFRQQDAAVRLVQFELLGTRDAERLPATFALESRRVRRAGEKVGVRPTQILDGLLQRMARRIPQP